jgi:PAS domain S-box-containing protein
MQDKNKTKEQLTKELTGLRQRIAKLERAENKRKKEVLRGSERELREVIDSVKDGIVLLDLTGTVTAINKSVTEAVGYAEEDVVGKRFKLLKMFPPKSIAAMLTAFTRVISGQQPPPYEVEVYTRTGEKLFVEIHGSILRKGGAKAGVITALRDITERKQMEALLLRERDTFVTILQHALYGVVLLDRDGNYVFVNSAFTAITGYTLEDIPTTRDWLHKAYPDEAYRQQVTEFWEKDRRVGVMRREVSVVCKNGETKKIEFGSTVLGDGRAVVMLADITERKRAEEALERHHEDLEKLVTERTASLQAANEQLQREITERKRVEKKLQRAYGELKESEERFRTIFETAQDFIALKDRDCKFTYVNPAMERVFGISASKLIGKTSVALFGKGKSARIIEEDLRVLSGEIINEEHPSPVKGSSAIHNIIKVPIRNSAGEIIGLCNIGRDITERKQMEEALRESEEKYRSLVESSEDSIYLVDSKCNYIFLNNRHLARLGVQSSEIIGKGYSEFHNPEESKDFAQRIKTVLKTGQSLSYEYRSQRDNRYFIRTLSPVKTPDGGVIKAITVISKDITERKQAEEALRQSEERYRTLADNAKFGLNLIDSDYNIVMVNAALSKNLQKKTSELIGKKCFQEFEKRDAVCPHCPGTQAMATGKSAEIEREGSRDNGRHYYARFRAFPILGQDGKAAAFIEFVEDITKRKQMEDELRKSEEKYRELINGMHDTAWVIDFDGNFIDMNNAAVEILGYSREELLSMGPHDIDSSLDAETITDLIKGMQTDKLQVFETTHTTKDGKAIPVEIESSLVTYQGKQAILSIARDITERKLMEQELRESHQELQALMDASPVAISWADMHGNIKYINRKHHELFGYTLEEIPTIDEWQCQADHDPVQRKRFARWGEELMEAHKQGKSLPLREMTVTCKDGSMRYVTVEGAVVSNHNLVIYNDITERKQMEDELRESESRFRLLVEHSKDALLLHDFDGKIIDVNQHTCESLGYTREELLNLSIEDIDDDVLPGKHKEKWKQMVVGEPITLQGVHRRKDGTTFPVEVRLGVFESGGRRLMLGMVRDVTERKRAEERLQRYAAELERSNEEVKNFAYIVSHDLRVPLVNLKGYTSELQAALEVIGPTMETALPHLNEDKRSAVAMALHEDVPEALEFITNSVSRMDSFINSVLILSRLGRRELKPEPIDMNALVQMSLENLSHQIQERGTTVTVGSLPQVVADRTAMEQIMGNILGNAVKYLDSERTGQIEVTAQTNNGEQLFCIRDNGRGIAQEDMHKVFAPFRRAGKQDTQGEGMGLAYVQTLVRRHNGRIWCESDLGKGTTFTFSISQQRAEGRDYVAH